MQADLIEFQKSFMQTKQFIGDGHDFDIVSICVSHNQCSSETKFTTNSLTSALNKILDIGMELIKYIKTIFISLKDRFFFAHLYYLRGCGQRFVGPILTLSFKPLFSINISYHIMGIKLSCTEQKPSLHVNSLLSFINLVSTTTGMSDSASLGYRLSKFSTAIYVHRSTSMLKWSLNS